MFIVETMVRKRGGKPIWIRKAAFDFEADARACYAYFFTGPYASDWRIRDASKP